MGAWEDGAWEDGAWEDGVAIPESDDSRSDDSRSFALRLKKITRTRTGLAKNDGHCSPWQRNRTPEPDPEPWFWVMAHSRALNHPMTRTLR